jgi:tRNA-binding protein
MNNNAITAPKPENLISWDDFQKVDIRIGTIVRVDSFPKAKKPAYKLWVDLGEELGIKQSSAQITDLYTQDALPGQQVLCVVNFPPRQVADFMSEILVTGFILAEGSVVLAQPGKPVPNGTRLA